MRNANEDIHKPGPPSTIVIGAVSSSGVSAPKSPIDLDSEDTNWQEDLVLRCTAATNVYFVRAVLLETDGDTDAAIEYIIALSQGSELEESVQREFAYEHGIFPPGGFPDDDVPFFQATSSPATSNPSDNAESSDSSASNKESAKSENTASSISASLSPGIDAETQQLMEHMTDEEMAMFLQQEESRLWSEGHGISTDPSSDFSASSSATSSRSTGNGRQGTSNGSKASSNVSPKKKDSEEERAKAYKGNPKKGSESSAETASSSSSKPVHPKLERLYVIHTFPFNMFAYFTCNGAWCPKNASSDPQPSSDLLSLVLAFHRFHDILPIATLISLTVMSLPTEVPRILTLGSHGRLWRCPD